jgi:CubicO group peptidase (beta-lactamase class C family)
MTLTQRLTSHIDAAIASGREEGIQLAVYHRGQLIVDITRGTRDDAGTPMRPNDMTMLWSASKGVTATCLHILAERGLIAYDDAIADYWPAFAAHGKAAISIRHLMSHTAGIPFLPDDVTNDILADYDAICAIVADLRPISRAGQVAAYHGLTYGWPLANVLEAVDGRPFGQFVQDEICAPLGITDLYCGLPTHRRPDVARFSHDLGADADAHANPCVQGNHPGIHATCMPANNFMASAHALARVYASLIGDGVDGVRLLPARRIAQATKVQRWAMDAVIQAVRGFGLGYFLGESLPINETRDTTFGHNGLGGNVGFADPVLGIAFALTKTRLTMTNHTPTLAAELADIVRDALGARHTASA